MSQYKIGTCSLNSGATATGLAGTPTTGGTLTQQLPVPVNAAFTAGAGTLVTGTYYYRVTALNALGETLPSTETSLAITGPAGVNVNWGAVANATGYRIYGRSTGAELLIAEVGAVTTYLDNGSITPSGAMPTVNTTGRYYYVASVIYPAGESIKSSEIYIDIIAPDNAVSLSWNAVTGASTYRIYRGIDPASENIYYTSATNSFTDIGATATTGTPLASSDIAQKVIGSGTLWLANVLVGDTFKRKGENAIYTIGAVNSNTQITLTANYAGTAGSGLEYQITRDFTTNLGLTEISAGDIDWPYHLTQGTIRKIDEKMGQVLNPSASPTHAGLTLTGFSGIVKATAGVLSAAALTDTDIPNDITLTNITQITNRSHTNLSDIGTNTHATIDSYLDQAVKTTSSPVFAGLTVDTNTLYVDATNNRVGIGTASPGYLLDVQKDFGDTVGVALRIANSATVSSGTASTRLLFSNHTTGGRDGGAIDVKSNTAGGDNMSMAFWVRDNANTLQERMRINVAGNVGIGVTSPTAVLHLKAGTVDANTAPLKFTAGINTTVAVAGQMEYDGTDLFFTPSTTRLTALFKEQIDTESEFNSKLFSLAGITLTNITQITNRSHASLTAIGTNTHDQIDTHIATNHVNSFNARTGVVVPATNDYTWAMINKTTSNIADITTKSHTSLTDIGSLTHATIDSYLDQAVKIASSPTFAGLTANGNVGIGVTDFGTSATKTLGIGTGVAPSTSPLDMFQLYSADIQAGEAAPHFRTEHGDIIKLYQQEHIPDAIETLADVKLKLNVLLGKLENLGFFATA